MEDEMTLTLTMSRDDAALLLQIVHDGHYAGAIVEDVARLKLQLKSVLQPDPKPNRRRKS